MRLRMVRCSREDTASKSNKPTTLPSTHSMQCVVMKEV